MMIFVVVFLMFFIFSFIILKAAKINRKFWKKKEVIYALMLLWVKSFIVMVFCSAWILILCSFLYGLDFNFLSSRISSQEYVASFLQAANTVFLLLGLHSYFKKRLKNICYGDSLDAPLQENKTSNTPIEEK